MSLSKILHELRSWRALPSQRARISARPLDQEVPDPVPMAIPVGYDAPPTMTELIQRYVRLEVSQQASADDLGTFAEEDDFTEDDQEGLPFPQFGITDEPLVMTPDPDMPDAPGVDDVADVPDPPPAEPPETEPPEPPATSQ